MAKNPLLQVEALEKTIDGRTILKDLSFSIHPGELLVLLGASGSGKTLTLRMVNRLVEPSAGVIRLEGQDTRGITPHLLRRAIGYVVQDAGLFPRMTVGDNIAITPRLLQWDEEKVEARVRELLTLVKLDPDQYGHRRPSDLSGGEKQRVGVARALAASPKLILLDEPFGALDPMTRFHLQCAFQDLRRTLNMAGIFVTHDIAEALLLGDRIAVMHEGQIVQCDTPETLLSAPKTDYVRAIMTTPEALRSAIEARFAQ